MSGNPTGGDCRAGRYPDGPGLLQPYRQVVEFSIISGRISDGGQKAGNFARLPGLPGYACWGAVVIPETQENVSQNSAFLVIFGGLLAMLGVIAIASPLAMGVAVDLFVGVMALSRGAMLLYYGFKVRHWGHRFGSYMGIGSIVIALMSVAVGVLLLINPIAGLRFLTFVLAVYLVVGGGFEVLHSIELSDAKGWFYVTLSGLASVALGVMIWLQWPISGRLAMGLMVGASFLVSGASLVMLGLAGRLQAGGDSPVERVA